METRLIKLVNNILRNDSMLFLWYKDESLDGHFRIGSPEQSYIEYSYKMVAKEPLGKLIVHQDEYTQLQWRVSYKSKLYHLLQYLEQDAINLKQNQAYLKRLQSNVKVKRMSPPFAQLVDGFFNEK